MLLTRRALFLLLIPAPLMVVAVWLPALVWLAGFAFLIAVVLSAVDWFAAGSITIFQVERRHDNRLSLGAENGISLNLRHRESRPIHVLIRDEPPPEFEGALPVREGTVVPGNWWRQSYTVRPTKRGNHRFGDINLRWLGPLGLAIRQGHVPAAEQVKVYPDLLGVKRYDFLLRRNRLQELGLRNTRLTGQGTEFERLREYRQDDEYRRINWKATARRLRPITVAYQTERSQNIIIALDTGRMMQSAVGRLSKLDYAINAALLLAFVAIGTGDKVGLLAFAATVHQYIAPRQGRQQFYKMLDALYAVGAQPVEPDYRRGLTYLAYRQRRRALIVLFTDIPTGESMSTLVQNTQLLRRHSLPLVVTISDPDLRTMAERRPATTSEMYQRAMAGQMLQERRMVLETLQRQGVDTLDAPANQLSPEVVSRYLELKRKARI